MEFSILLQNILHETQSALTLAHVLSSATKYIQLDYRKKSVRTPNITYISFRFFLETMNYGQ